MAYKIRVITRVTGCQPGQCRITLNAENVLPDGEHGTPSSWAQMWATFLREMCHAYDRVRARGRDGHGKHFGTRYMAVYERWNTLFGMCGSLLKTCDLKHNHFDPSELRGGAGEVASGIE